MSLAAGTHIGPYEIVGWLGAGGMGEVYRARDARLNRDVAIKLVAGPSAPDSSRVDRFAQEARAAGQLNHPNVLVVYDVGTHDGLPYIVSELLDGESLRRRLEGGALALRKAVDCARQIAEGLAAAHDKGIVHRDLKPDNLFITTEGRVKILDFGLAKLTQAVEGPAKNPSEATEVGAVLGTVGYMSPEQVRGEQVDQRSDLFSFGVIFHEMLTGQRAFTRSTAADTMAAILKEEPSGTLSGHATQALERIVMRCLEKAREARFQSARDLAFGLEGLSDAGAPAALHQTSRVGRVPRPWGWLGVGAVISALAVVLAAWSPWRNATPSTPLRLSAQLGGGLPLAPLNAQFGDAFALARDGNVMAFVAQDGESARPQLYVRRLGQLAAMPLPGTDGALAPFFSPDSAWIGFFAGTTLKKIAVTGGAAVTLAEVHSNRGGTWSDDGTVVFTPNQIEGTHLMRVPGEGGAAEALTSLDEAEVIQLWPQVLPGGKAVLFTSSGATGSYNDANLVVQQLPEGRRTVVQRGGFHGRYLASGHLVYIHDGTLWAAPFDLDRMETTGPPAPALEGVRSNALTGGAQFSVSANGTLVYLPGAMVGAAAPVRWVSAEGTTTPLKSGPVDWYSVRFAPDGRRLALEVREQSFDLWVYEWGRDVFTRLTLDQADERNPVWTPDSRGIAFASTRDQPAGNLYWQRTDGSGAIERLTRSPRAQRPMSWHPSGRFLSFTETMSPTKVAPMILPLEGDAIRGWTPGVPVAFSDTDALIGSPMFSPDGRWLAYSSTESGRSEVYVRPFPGPGGTWLISTGGGNLPTWSPTKPEILYNADGQIMVVGFTVNGGVFRAEKPRPWPGARHQTRGQNRLFDVHPDGDRLALAPAFQTPGYSQPDNVVFFFNFFDELRRIAPKQ